VGQEKTSEKEKAKIPLGAGTESLTEAKKREKRREVNHALTRALKEVNEGGHIDEKRVEGYTERNFADR